MEKYCPRCRQWKELDQYHSDSHRLLRRFHLCKKCRREKYTPREKVFKKISNDPKDYAVPQTHTYRYSEILAAGIAKGNLVPQEVKACISAVLWIEVCNFLVEWKK